MEFELIEYHFPANEDKKIAKAVLDCLTQKELICAAKKDGIIWNRNRIEWVKEQLLDKHYQEDEIHEIGREVWNVLSEDEKTLAYEQYQVELNIKKEPKLPVIPVEKFSIECKLYRFDEALEGWEELGEGPLKIFEQNVECVLRMQCEDTEFCGAIGPKEFDIRKRLVKWNGVEEGIDRLFAAKFKTEENARFFKKQIDRIQIMFAPDEEMDITENLPPENLNELMAKISLDDPVTFTLTAEELGEIDNTCAQRARVVKEYTTRRNKNLRDLLFS